MADDSWDMCMIVLSGGGLLSKLIETRAEFQRMAEERLEEARGLISLAKGNGAYYLAGYAVELALKACIIKRLMATDAFPTKDFSRDCYTHALDKLLELTDLDAALTAGNANLKTNWVLTKDWSEHKRYHFITEVEGRTLIDAISDATNGVLPWLKTHY